MARKPPPPMRIHASAIHYFDAVRRAGSIREAARRLNVASSAVNRQILKLENEVGVSLFDRNAGGVTLTAAGEVLAHHVIVVFQDLERARTEIHALKGARIGNLSVATVEGVCSTLLPAVLSKLRRKTPRITVSAETMGSTEIPERLTAGLSDLGIAYDLPRTPGLREIFVARFKLGAMMAPNHPLAHKQVITFAECANYPMVYALPELSIDRLLQPLIARSHRGVAPIIRTNSIELMRRLSMEAPNIGFLTRIGQEHEIADGRLIHIPLDDKGPVWTELGVHIRAGRSIPAAIDFFLQILVEELSSWERRDRT
jgi:DNA-binding transcriptional LysR family regulator